MTLLDIGAVVAITILAVGNVKLSYAYAADRAGALFTGRAGETMNSVALGVFIIAMV